MSRNQKLQNPTLQKRGLAALLAEYESEYAPKLDDQLKYFRGLESLDDAIRFACHGREGKIDPHQHLVGKKRLEQARLKLQKHAREIVVCQSFDELIENIETWTDSISRFGVLAIYDTSLRLGAHLKLRPKAIYVHAGTRAGYKALDIPVSRGTADVRSLPRPLDTLAPHHAENFLCIFADRLCGAAVTRKPSRC